MDVYTAERCGARARRCMGVFQGIASGDFSEQWIERNLNCMEFDLLILIEEVKKALGETGEEDRGGA